LRVTGGFIWKRASSEKDIGWYAIFVLMRTPRASHVEDVLLSGWHWSISKSDAAEKKVQLGTMTTQEVLTRFEKAGYQRKFRVSLSQGNRRSAKSSSESNRRPVPHRGKTTDVHRVRSQISRFKDSSRSWRRRAAKAVCEMTISARQNDHRSSSSHALPHYRTLDNWESLVSRSHLAYTSVGRFSLGCTSGADTKVVELRTPSPAPLFHTLTSFVASCCMLHTCNEHAGKITGYISFNLNLVNCRITFVCRFANASGHA